MSHRIQFRLARKLRAGFASGHASSGDSQPTLGGLNSPKLETMEPAKGGLDLEKELTCSVCLPSEFIPHILLFLAEHRILCLGRTQGKGILHLVLKLFTINEAS